MQQCHSVVRHCSMAMSSRWETFLNTNQKSEIYEPNAQTDSVVQPEKQSNHKGLREIHKIGSHAIYHACKHE